MYTYAVGPVLCHISYVVDWLCKIFCQPFSVLIIGCWEATMSAIYYALLTTCHTTPWTAIYHLMLEVYQTICYWHSTLLFIMHCWQHAIPYREVSFIISCWAVLEVTKPFVIGIPLCHWVCYLTCYTIPWTASYHVKLELYQATCCWHFTLPFIMLCWQRAFPYHEQPVIMSNWKSTRLSAVGISLCHVYYAWLTTCYSIPWTASYYVNLEFYQAICCWHLTLP